MRNKMRVRSAFTLLEIAVSIGVITIGLTAAVVVYFTGVRWANDAKLNYTAYATARSVYNNAIILKTDPNFVDTDPADNLQDSCKGYLNGFYVVRTVESKVDVGVLAGGKAGTMTEVRVNVYDGGTDVDGEEAVELHAKLFVPAGYGP